MAAEEDLVERVVMTRSVLPDADDPHVHELCEVQGHRWLGERKEIAQFPAGDLTVVREGLSDPQAHLVPEGFEDAGGGWHFHHALKEKDIIE